MLLKDLSKNLERTYSAAFYNGIRGVRNSFIDQPDVKLTLVLGSTELDLRGFFTLLEDRYQTLQRYEVRTER